MKKTQGIMALTIVCLMTGQASAQSAISDYIDQWYAGVSLSYVAVSDSDTVFKVSPDPTTEEGDRNEFDSSFDNAAGLGLRLGFRSGNFRWDLELRSSEHDSDQLRITEESGGLGGGRVFVSDVDGSVEIESAIFTGFYDVEMLSVAGFTPYVGLGFGGSRLNVEDEDDTVTVGRLSIGARTTFGENLVVSAGVDAVESFQDAKINFKEGELRMEYSSQSLRFNIDYLF